MIAWVDASSGASGDMLLGALLGAGVPLEVIAEAVAAVAPEHVALRPESVVRVGEKCCDVLPGPFRAAVADVDVAPDGREPVTHNGFRPQRDVLGGDGGHRFGDHFDRYAGAEQSAQ